MSEVVIRNGRIVTPDGVCAGDLVVRDGVIARVGPGAGREAWGAGESAGRILEIDARGALVLPGFIDLHVHGAAGATPMSGDPAALRSMARTLAAWGVTAFCPTTMAAPADQLLRAVESISTAAGMSRRPDWDGAVVLGANCEGPYLNPDRRGAQPVEHLRAPDAAEVREIHTAARGDLRIMSLAPELPGALPVIEWLAGRGVVVSAAHTSATWEEAELAVSAGLRHATHLFNAMRPLHHREPGIVGLALTDDRVWVEAIADGFHLHRGVVGLIRRAKGPGRACVVSDLTQMAGMPPGSYEFSGQGVIITEEKATLCSDGGLAGSVTPPCRVFRNLLRWGCSPVEAASLMSRNPARRLGIDGRKGSIAPGKDADIVVITESGDVKATLVGGRAVYLARG